MKTHKAAVWLVISTRGLSVEALKSALRTLNIHYEECPKENEALDISYSAFFADADFDKSFSALSRKEVHEFEIPRLASLLRAYGVFGLTEKAITYQSSRTV